MQSRDKYSERVEVVLGRSRMAEGLVAVATLATLALVAATPLPLEAQAGALAWAGAGALVALRRLREGTRLALSRAGEVRLGGAEGALRDRCFVAPWLAVVRWRPAGARFDRTLLVAPDMLGAEDFRRLRVLLRFATVS